MGITLNENLDFIHVMEICRIGQDFLHISYVCIKVHPILCQICVGNVRKCEEISCFGKQDMW